MNTHARMLTTTKKTKSYLFESNQIQAGLFLDPLEYVDGNSLQHVQTSSV